MPNILPICLQDKLWYRKSAVRKQIITKKTALGSFFISNLINIQTQERNALKSKLCSSAMLT